MLENLNKAIKPVHSCKYVRSFTFSVHAFVTADYTRSFPMFRHGVVMDIPNGNHLYYFKAMESMSVILMWNTLIKFDQFFIIIITKLYASIKRNYCRLLYAIIECNYCKYSLKWISNGIIFNNFF